MQFSVTALADEVVIPEEAVEIVETSETEENVAPETTGETETPVAEETSNPTDNTPPTDTTDIAGSTDTTDTTGVTGTTDTNVATDTTNTTGASDTTGTTDTPESTETKETTDTETIVPGETTDTTGETTSIDEGTAEEKTDSTTETTDTTAGAKATTLLLEDDEIATIADETTDGEDTSNATTTYKYAVQIYDIGVDDVWTDTDGDGVVDDGETSKGGLTFGPAIGADYTSTSKNHTPSDGTTDKGNTYRCVHSDDWNTIIEWNNKDPYVYQECLNNGCTKSVPLTLTSDNSEATKDTSGTLGYKAFYSGVTTEVTGDGPGVLIDEIARSNQRYSANTSYTAVTWADSKIRAVLNGMQPETSTSSWDKGDFTADTNSVLSAFPSELQKAIGKKVVQYATAYNSMASSATCYDKLWLLSNIEVFGSSLSSKYAYTGEGTQYKRMQNVASDSDRIAYSSSSTAKYWWTRSRYNSSKQASCVASTGKINNVQLIQTDTIGLAPGFVLATSAFDDEQQKEETTYKYAVQIYDIGVDDVWTDADGDGVVDDGETSKGGLTFGPAIGEDYTGCTTKTVTDSTTGEETKVTIKYNSCEEAGIDKSGQTAAGNSYRCIHDDEWGSTSTEDTILYWNLKDPHVYDQCLENGCTRSIELTLDDNNSEAASDKSTKVFIKSDSAVTLTGDGPGILIDIIQKEARKYADQGDSGLTWVNSQLRAVLNGAQTETGSTYGGAEYTEANSVLSAFPTDLQNAIGKKAVTYATDVTNVSSAVQTCYDRLWLCSVKELAFTSSSTVFTNEGTAYAWPTAVMKSKSAIQSWEVFVNNNGTVGSSEAYWWTRTRTKGDATKSARVNNSGKNAGGKDVTLSDDDDRNIGFGPSFVLARSTTTDPEPEETQGYRYAVQIYGICVDEVKSQKTEDTDGTTYVGGLTFGPAIGGDYTSSSISHDVNEEGYIIDDDGNTEMDAAGNKYRCIHKDKWGSTTTENTILYWNKEDPYVYEKCLTNHCTKAVELDLDENNSSADNDATKVFKQTGTTYKDGDGVGALYNEVQETSRHWGDHYNKDTDLDNRNAYFAQLNWSNSVIRAALNGYTYHQVIDDTQTSTTYGATYSSENSILSAFPEDLQNAIGQKAVVYATAYNVTSKTGTSYDKLWLFSTKEIYGHTNSDYYYPLEGNQYTRTNGLTMSDGTAVYTAAGESNWTWLRSSYKRESGRAAMAFNKNTSGMGRSWVDNDQNTGYGISPGFTLYREGAKPEEAETGYRYAVQLYDIGVDDVWTDADGNNSIDDGEVTKGGLTFGPAIGDNYTAKHKDSHAIEDGDLTDSHTLGDGSVIKGGNQKRCIHNDDWETIIEWNEIDPYVYWDCIENACTKTVPLTLTEGQNASTATSSDYVFLINDNYKVTGDGAGVLISELQARSRYWADVNSGGHNWENSRVRAALNGYSYTNTYVTTNSYSSSNSVLSAFPSELQSAIGKKAVIYTKTYNDRSSTDTVYDQLWLLSTVELYGDISTSGYNNWCYPNEGSQYKRGTSLAVGTSGLATAYNAGGSANWSWSRTLYNSSTHATCILNYNSGQKRAVDQSNVNTSNWGISPAFTLSRSASDHNDVVQLPVTGGEGRDTIYTMAITLAILALAGLHLRRRRSDTY